MTYVNPWRLFHGAFVPNWLARLPDVSPGAKITYGRLGQYAGREGVAWPDQAELAEEVGVGIRQVRRYLSELEAASMIEVEQRGLNQPNRYRFLLHGAMGLQTEVTAPERTDPSGPDGTSTAAHDGTDPSGPSSVQESGRESEPPSSPEGDPKADPMYGWERFWDRYPKRNGKRLGKKKTAEKWRKMSTEDKAQAWRAVQHYARACDSGLTIARDPERFLANGWYEDWADGPAQAAMNAQKDRGTRPEATALGTLAGLARQEAS